MTCAKSKLRERLGAYDGRATTILGEAEAALSHEAGYLDALITLVAQQEGHFANGASWLLKSALEGGAKPSTKQTKALIDNALIIQNWVAQLHICQLIRHMEVPEIKAAQLCEWLSHLLVHRRPFVRAWSLDALSALAGQHADYADVFNAALEEARGDDAASVRARARRLNRV